jgi:RNA-directed DNA polymerase
MEALRNDSKLKEFFFVRYADDFVIFCKTPKTALKIFKATESWLGDRLKLSISPEKSRIVNLNKKSLSFLGINLRAPPPSDALLR